MRRKINLILVGLLVGLVLLCWPANPLDLSTKKITIPPGASVAAVQKILQKSGLLPAFSSFRYLVRIIGQQNKLQAGTYQFSPSDSLFNIIFKLVRGDVVPQTELTVTFPEGMSIYKMGLVLKKSGYKQWAEFQDLIHEGIKADLRQRHWNIFKYIPSESLEGYLYPDTYRVYENTSSEVLAEAMIKRFDQVVMPFWTKSNKSTRLTLHEVLTLASIIEKEAQKPEERVIISSVFHNRLEAGMPLAADPTIKYALEQPTKRVYYDQLKIDSLYNTYKRRGLPPGPICNPGIESIRAAIYPAKTSYFFFVAKKDGHHVFSRTWQEHQKARNEQ
ncbi:hypothetical protein A2311_05055 [candidate division WOR-1 bacterium RIFOXYB2_FULL_48_7]|uniref:Endolytic murein transglycosylase n=1 Tax=candidate division WOR-1 bacterium RIFOXYB2_FULL_48_7 TaxID=1802583 RepID=A0A1F4TM60_UNCSA|nr:MAG: hypothetical protein A2311_05055 [candidate division WOR-1 bacterium RIFOXYB2_FULL_48_7]